MLNRYEVFISYAADASDWVLDVFVPLLEAAGLRVCRDAGDFVIGWSTITAIKHAVAISRHTVIVLTPDWVAADKLAGFAALLESSEDPAGQVPRLVPILLLNCTIPSCIEARFYVDFTDPRTPPTQLTHLITLLKGSNSNIAESILIVEPLPPSRLSTLVCRCLREDLSLLENQYVATASQHRQALAADQKILLAERLTSLEQDIAAIEEQLRGCPPST